MRAARASTRWQVVGGPRSSRQVFGLRWSWFEGATNYGMAFLGKPVFLLAAARLIGNGHFQQSGIERWLQVCLDKVVPMAQTQFFLKFGSAQCSIANSQQSLDLPGDLPGNLPGHSISQFPHL